MTSNSTNAKKHYEVTKADLPLHCPTPEMSKWNSHPRVYLPIEKTGKAKCPYCGAEYVLIDFDPNHAGGH
ncbi:MULTISPECIES: zinc-finger domain-containing protein [Thiomicrorhabdus]|uniref:Zinc-finger domain-containing protein n=1 Tax=Thiomicrorhabdus heinhorstiae TaxID=2748010 RepID=A0ABS0BZY5_9GAMM|nr:MULTISPECIES: zinc-finger domain-containing protein [Thiomicrorhabdus]MBF6058643.1 zinc-finger domain-containing protein [Thiomicrorhabdus heinhorstiae]